MKTTRIFEAWSDEAWVNDGAAVRVSLVAFGDALHAARRSAGNGVAADLSARDSVRDRGVDLTESRQLATNACNISLAP